MFRVSDEHLVFGVAAIAVAAMLFFVGTMPTASPGYGFAVDPGQPHVVVRLMTYFTDSDGLLVRFVLYNRGDVAASASFTVNQGTIVRTKENTCVDGEEFVVLKPGESCLAFVRLTTTEGTLRVSATPPEQTTREQKYAQRADGTVKTERLERDTGDGEDTEEHCTELGDRVSAEQACCEGLEVIDGICTATGQH